MLGFPNSLAGPHFGMIKNPAKESGSIVFFTSLGLGVFRRPLDWRGDVGVVALEQGNISANPHWEEG